VHNAVGTELEIDTGPATNPHDYVNGPERLNTHLPGDRFIYLLKALPSTVDFFERDQTESSKEGTGSWYQSRRIRSTADDLAMA
jgi:hypothetical protein